MYNNIKRIFLFISSNKALSKKNNYNMTWTHFIHTRNVLHYSSEALNKNKSIRMVQIIIFILKKECQIDMHLRLTEEQKMVQETIRSFVENELMPLENEVLRNEIEGKPSISPEKQEELVQKA